MSFLGWLRPGERKRALREMGELAAILRTGEAERPLPDAKGELQRLLREEGARSAIVAYDGGNDEGGVTEIRVSGRPLPVQPRAFTGDLPAARPVEIDWDELGKGTLLDAATDVVCAKWGSFAGEFAVRGRLVVDVDSGLIARQDDVWEFGEEDYRQLEESEEEIPRRAPDERSVEDV